jgi:hypothetical protein
MTKFRKDDIVSVEGRVVERPPGRKVVVEIDEGDGCFTTVLMPIDRVKLVKPGPAQLGDTVIVSGDEGLTYTVLAFDGDLAWLKRIATGSYRYSDLRNLVVVERA